MNNPPQVTYSALSEGKWVEGLVDLPIDEFLAKVTETFPGSKRERNASTDWVVWVSVNGLDSFQVTWSRQYVRVDCRHLHSEDMNRLIDIGRAFGCPLYDPQISERFRSIDG